VEDGKSFSFQLQDSSKYKVMVNGVACTPTNGSYYVNRVKADVKIVIEKVTAQNQYVSVDVTDVTFGAPFEIS
jgi:hypothetical protein